MEKKVTLTYLVDEVSELVQQITVTEILSDLEDFKVDASKILAGAQALSALVHIAELTTKEISK